MTFLEVYQQLLRLPFFSGFLTATGFLFTAKSFVITNLVKEIYGNKDYQQHVKEVHALDSNASLMRPVRILQRDFIACTVITLITSVCQVTIGFVPDTKAAFVCCFLAGVAVLSILFAMYRIRVTMQDLFDFMETQYGPKSTGSTEDVSDSKS